MSQEGGITLVSIVGSMWWSFTDMNLVDIFIQHLHGKFAQHPFCNRRLKIVCDTMVDPEFGTGKFVHTNTCGKETQYGC